MSDEERLLRRLFTEGAERTERAEAVYEALRVTGKLASHRVLSYRCATRRCLLLDVLLLPDGIVVASPRYKVSEPLNRETSTDGGRRAHTTDGNRRWKASAYYAEDAANFTVNCDHVVHGIIDKHDVETDLEAGRREAVWPRRVP